MHENRPISVSQLNHLVKSLLDSQIDTVLIEGEVSNLMKASSGHWYFSLKDDQAQISCVFFKQYHQNHDIVQGDQIQIAAKVSLYEPRGTYQCIVYQVMPIGFGQKQLEFERLKKKLAQEGLFANERKITLPKFPQTIGLITSKDGAALHDILHILKKRMPMIKVIIYPCLVQGKEASSAIIQALDKAYTRQEVDTLIITRGGGSIEDLWPFNDEALAYKLAASPIPTIAAVGHETDFTIVDFIADIRAPTPSGAAEIISPDQQHLKALLDQLNWQLEQSMNFKINTVKTRLQQYSKRLITPSQALLLIKQRLRQYHDHLEQTIRNSLIGHQHDLAVYVEKLALLSPLKTLARGYTITMDKHDKLIQSVKQVNKNEYLKVKLKDGHITSKITDISQEQ